MFCSFRRVHPLPRQPPGEPEGEHWGKHLIVTPHLWAQFVDEMGESILVLLRFLNMQVSVFHQIWDVFSCYFFRYSLSVLLGYTFCWYTWWYPTDLWISVPLSSLLFFFCSSNWININWPIFQFVNSFTAAQICCWDSLMNFLF